MPQSKDHFHFHRICLETKIKVGDPVNSACKGQGQFRPICCFVSTQVHESATIISNSILATIIALIPITQVYDDSQQYCRLLLPTGIEKYIYFVIYLILDFGTNSKTFVIRTSSIGSTKVCGVSFRKCSFLNVCFTMFHNKISFQDLQRRPFFLNSFKLDLPFFLTINRPSQPVVSFMVVLESEIQKVRYIGKLCPFGCQRPSQCMER